MALLPYGFSAAESVIQIGICAIFLCHILSQTFRPNSLIYMIAM
ncbi:hypothetical protein SAMN04488512_1473 [Sulfitobacter litoralis]|jgi:hypothetical protein|uniref:Uncharacterized protein n=1 Tax=Sulfitobacter litoralis TaxID=335975 RepID=A0ABY0T1W4_9RHOB|nr:hypothetical protein SAMN04488512_1473 [Sulfitobacter litoralis]